MSPLQFETRHAAEWDRLAQQLDLLERPRRKGNPGIDAAALAAGYRQVCGQLALARTRAYPLHLVERLASLSQRAHRHIYREAPNSLARLQMLVCVLFPRRLRAHGGSLLLATLAFVLPLLAALAATWRDPAFALTVVDAQQLVDYEQMYGDGSHALGRLRDAGADWQMFGFYIRNNISIAFQCFATGLLLGVGSLFFLVANGVVIGTIAGYLTARGLGHNFWPFVATHGAFELTAIVIAGAAGLTLGHALLAPGGRSRSAALQAAAREAAVLIGGATVMLLLAAAVEAFWSSARWVDNSVKFGVAALCWLAVLLFLARSGRVK